jgi:hypothetical protein
VQPLVLSPKACTCIPRSAFASLPVMFHEMVVLLDSESCSNVTVPLTLESPRSTATGEYQLLDSSPIVGTVHHGAWSEGL